LNGGTPGINEFANQTQYPNGSNSISMSNGSSQGGKPVNTKNGSIFPSTTTATTANSLTEKHQQHLSEQQ
jgi:hypothetical protein